MDHIYADANEKWVKNTVVYVNGDDGYVYLDQECTVKATKEQLTNLFMKGMLLYEAGFMLVPIVCEDCGNYCVIVSKDCAYYSAECTETPK